MSDTYTVLVPFQSTLSLRRATGRKEIAIIRDGISIHALLAESDRFVLRRREAVVYFNPRSPCGERPLFVVVTIYQLAISIHALLAESDQFRAGCQPGRQNFNPRSPCGERRAYLRWDNGIADFNPRSPCGERPRMPIITDVHSCISIHALLAESDVRWDNRATCVF